MVGVMKKKISEMESQFKQYRLTPQRRLVLEIFLENREKHLSAEEIYQLSRQKEEIGLATIYRTLDLLEELGLLSKINFGDGRSRYELIQDGLNDTHNHHHLICLNCGRIQEVEEDLLHKLEEIVERKHHFSIVNHNLQFYGYCNRCNNGRKDL